jgi:cold shock CspA family protein
MSDETQTQTGTVCCYDDFKGFGFIAPSRGGRDIYVSKRHVHGELLRGDAVEFSIGDYYGRPEARDVRVL